MLGGLAGYGPPYGTMGGMMGIDPSHRPGDWICRGCGFNVRSLDSHAAHHTHTHPSSQRTTHHPSQLWALLRRPSPLCSHAAGVNVRAPRCAHPPWCAHRLLTLTRTSCRDRSCRANALPCIATISRRGATNVWLGYPQWPYGGTKLRVRLLWVLLTVDAACMLERVVLPAHRIFGS